MTTFTGMSDAVTMKKDEPLMGCSSDVQKLLRHVTPVEKTIRDWDLVAKFGDDEVMKDRSFRFVKTYQSFFDEYEEARLFALSAPTQEVWSACMDAFVLPLAGKIDWLIARW